MAPGSAKPDVQKQKDIEAAKQVEVAASAERLAVLGIVGKTYDAKRAPSVQFPDATEPARTK